MGAHIALHTFGSLGDLYPYFALGLGLQASGHRVTVVTSPYYREKVQRTGLGFHAVRPDLYPGDPEVMRRAMHPVGGTPYVIRDMTMPYIKDTFEDLVTFLPEVDLLVTGSLAYAAPVAVQQVGTKWLSSVLQPVQFFSEGDPPVLYPFLPEWLRRSPPLYRFGVSAGRRLSRRWSEPVDALRRSLGHENAPHPMFEGAYSPSGTLALFSPRFAPPQPDWPPRTTATGFLFYDQRNLGERLPAEIQNFLDEGEPPIVFTLGSSAVHTSGDFFAISREVVDALQRRAVFLVGDLVRSPNCSSNVMIAPYAPHAELFSQAAALVHHGGIGTTAQALRSGKPMLIVPFAHDQPDNAARVRRLGSGLELPFRRYTVRRALPKIARLLEDASLRENAYAEGQIVREEDGVGQAIRRIESLLDE